MLAVSLISWETTTLVMPNTSFSVLMSFTTTPIAMGSSPANGSSYMINCGSNATARASATRRAMPPDNSAGNSPAAPRRPTCWSLKSTRSRIIDSDRSVCVRSGNDTLS